MPSIDTNHVSHPFTRVSSWQAIVHVQSCQNFSEFLATHLCEGQVISEHPGIGYRVMFGQTSIKVALPAALKAASSQRIDRWLQAVNLLDPETGNRPENPYKLLPSLDLPGLESEASDTDAARGVTDGVEAMRAYQDMIYGLNMNAEGHRERVRESLLRYCRLDTLAQVIIWEHWQTS